MDITVSLDPLEVAALQADVDTYNARVPADDQQTLASWVIGKVRSGISQPAVQRAQQTRVASRYSKLLEADDVTLSKIDQILDTPQKIGQNPADLIQ